MGTYRPRAPNEDATNNDDDKAVRILADTCQKPDLWTIRNRTSLGVFTEETQRRLRSSTTLQKKEIQKELDRGFIKESNREQEENTKWFLPHCGIVSPAKAGKVRCIANAAAVPNETCLNDYPLPGLDLLNDLVGIILRSREKPILITTDIKDFFNCKLESEKKNASDFIGTNT